MIDIFPFSGLPIAVFGLGRSGISAAKALLKSDSEVWAWDDNLEVRNIAAKLGIKLVNLYECDWNELTTLVLSPGIPHTFPKPHPIVEMAKTQNIEIICDVELLGRSQRLSNMIGITGTNGKSTTTALIGHIMQLAGRDVEVGGNLGPPVLELEALGESGTYIIEMSSYQLELNFSITFDVGVLLNITADHLERHGGMEGYIAAKKRIFHRQTVPRTAVIGIDNGITKTVYSELSKIKDQNIIPISGEKPISGGVYAENGLLIDDTEGQMTTVCDLKEISNLPGVHNWQNAAAAYAACKAARIEPRVIMACLQSYPGLVHRQEIVDIVDGIIFINDSKATNSVSSSRALACYKNIFWIAGGRPKDTNLSVCEPYYSNVEHVYLVGESAIAFSNELNKKISCTISGNIDSAVKQAVSDVAKVSIENPIILLSPGCASFDQFSDFEERGDFFKKIVGDLPGVHIDPFDEPELIPRPLSPDIEKSSI